EAVQPVRERDPTVIDRADRRAFPGREQDAGRGPARPAALPECALDLAGNRPCEPALQPRERLLRVHRKSRHHLAELGDELDEPALLVAQPLELVAALPQRRVEPGEQLAPLRARALERRDLGAALAAERLELGG